MKKPAWMSRPEGGSAFGYRVFALFARACGRTAARMVLLPITLSPNLEGQQRAAHRRVNVADKRVVLPPKETAYGSIEGLMNHFMLIMEGYGIQPPPGEAYFPVEGANGELGFYVVSDGSDRPYRVRCRPPCLPPVAALHRMIEGEMVADLIPTFGSVNMIGGELDR